jgi:hypothetical protein
MSTPSADQSKKFLVMAAKLGHDPALAARGQTTVINVQSFEQLRELLGPDDVAERRRRSEALAAKGLGHHANLRARMEEYLFASGALPPDYQTLLAGYLPINVTAVSQENKVLPAGYVWDLGTSTQPVVINLGTLTMEKGSRIEIRNTYLKFSCEQLIRKS